MRLAVIACPSLKPELDLLADGLRVDVRFLEMALHERAPAALRRALQDAIEGADNCDAVGLGYGLCNGGAVGLTARHRPLVVPRAHDCIGLLLGSRRYLQMLADEPGTYFESAGWLCAARDVAQPVFGPNSHVRTEELAARYGEEAAAYLVEQLEGMTRHYRRLAFIATPAGEPFEAEARAVAERRALRFERVDGDTGWLRRLLDGDWNEAEFLVVQPGQTIVRTTDDTLIAAGRS